jgi:hypothetical protein
MQLALLEAVADERQRQEQQLQTQEQQQQAARVAAQELLLGCCLLLAVLLALLWLLMPLVLYLGAVAKDALMAAGGLLLEVRLAHVCHCWYTTAVPGCGPAMTDGLCMSD